MIRHVGVALVLAAAVACTVPWARHAAPPLDVNAASADALARLPGLGPEDAQRIVAGRPYYAKEDLRVRHVLSDEQYDRLRDQLVVGKPGTPDYLRWVPPEN